MPSLDEMLAAIEAEDGGEGTAPPEEPAAKPQVESKAFKNLRDHSKALERVTKAQEEELAELRRFKEETSASMLASAGFTPRQAEVFQRAYDAVTSENIAAFKAEVLGVTTTPAAQGETTVEFSPSGSTGELVEKPLSRLEFEDIARKDPARARQLLEAGKVAFRKGQGNE